MIIAMWISSKITFLHSSPHLPMSAFPEETMLLLHVGIDYGVDHAKISIFFKPVSGSLVIRFLHWGAPLKVRILLPQAVIHSITQNINDFQVYSPVPFVLLIRFVEASHIVHVALVDRGYSAELHVIPGIFRPVRGDNVLSKPCYRLIKKVKTEISDLVKDVPWPGSSLRLHLVCALIVVTHL